MHNHTAHTRHPHRPGRRINNNSLLSLIALPLLWLCLSLPVQAEPLRMGRHIPYSMHVDTHGVLSFAQAQQALLNTPAQLGTALSRGYTSETIWLRFELTPHMLANAERWLELGPNYLDTVELFYREYSSTGTPNPWQQRITGDLLNNPSDLDYRNPVFVLPQPSSPTHGYEFIIRLRSTSTVILTAKLWAPDQFLGHATRSASFWSFYFGLAVLSGLLALVLALILRTYVLWTTTAFSVAYLFIANIQGYITWVLPSMSVPLQHYATSVTMLMSFALLTWMSTETINLRQHLPWAHKILVRSCFLILSLMVLIPFGQYQLAVKIKILILLVTYPLFAYAVIALCIRRQLSWSDLGLGLSPMVCMVTSILGLLSVFGLIPFSAALYVTWQYALVVNMLLVLSISVYRIREQRLIEFEKAKLANELQIEREASFNQRQFIGTVSHEFRTPLAVISGALENLSYITDQHSPPAVSRYEKIKRANDRLIQLTDNCLADARLTGDVTVLDVQPTDVLQLITSAASLVGLSGKHSLAITADGQPLSAASPSAPPAPRAGWPPTPP